MRTFTLALIFFSIVCVSAFGQSEEKVPPILGVLAMAKFAGVCSVFTQMTRFQKSTQMAGGDEFVEKFIKSEAARLGHTDIEVLQQCETTIKTYSSVVDSLQQAEPK